MKLPLAISSEYQVDDLGNVYSFTNWRGRKERIMTPTLDENGYPFVRLTIDGFRIKKHVHYLVLSTFGGERPTLTHQARHLNGIKTDNRLTNLAWGTPKQNGEDKVRLGESSKGEANGASKLSESDVLAIKLMLRKGASQRLIAGIFDVSQTAIKYIHQDKTWAHV